MNEVTVVQPTEVMKPADPVALKVSSEQINAVANAQLDGPDIPRFLARFGARVTAKLLYGSRKLPIEEVAALVGATVYEISQWAEQDGWLECKEAANKIRAMERECELRRFQGETKVENAKRLVSIAEIAESKFIEIAKDLPTDEEHRAETLKILNAIARAISMISPMGSKASGLDKSCGPGTMDALTTKEQAEVNKGKTPLIMIGVNARVAKD